jgi:N-methylhydantoinase A
VLLSGDALSADAVAQSVAALGERARAALGEPAADLAAVYDVRYRGQAFELSVNADLRPQPHELRAAFEALHEDRYGYSDPEQTLELVTIRVTAWVAGIEVELDGDGDGGGGAEAARARRVAVIDGTQTEVEVLRGAPARGTEIEGPAVVELPESTLLVAPGWSGAVDATGTIVLSRLAPTQLENRPEGDSPGEGAR